MFVKEPPKLIAAISDGLASGDRPSIERAPHTLKSSSQWLGALPLSELARHAEIDAHENRLDEVTAHVREFSERFQEAAAQLESLREELAQAKPRAGVKA